MPANQKRTLTKDLLSWKAETRPFKKRGREYFSTIAAIVFLIVVILLLIKERLLIGVTIAITFFAYVLATVPPTEAEYKLTTKGVVIGEKTYLWDQLNRFWFSEKLGSTILHFETTLPFPRQLQIIVKGVEKSKVKEVASKYLVFEKPEKTSLDRAGDWLKEKVPLEN
jgi:hypothetical protein